MSTSGFSILQAFRFIMVTNVLHNVWVGSNDIFGRNSTLKLPAAYGPVLRKISKCHFFYFWQNAKKVMACIAPRLGYLV